MLADSLAAIGALMKGRSSSWPMLRLGRTMAVIRLVTGIRLGARWVPSAMNYADGPSRGEKVGVARETARKAEGQSHDEETAMSI